MPRAAGADAEPVDSQRDALQRAAALVEEGLFDDAVAALWSFLSEYPAAAQAWAMLAHAELCAGRCDQALDAAERAVGFAPGGTSGHVLASLALLQLGRAEEAVEHARRAAAVDPSDWRTLAVLARALQTRGGDLSEAYQVIERMATVAPLEPEMHMTAGRVYAASGDRESARRAFRRVLELEPGSGAAQHELARLRLGTRVNDPAALADAAAGFARAVRLEPEADRSRAGLEVLLRAFLSKAAYLLFLDAFLVGRLAGGPSSSGARVLPLVLLLLPFAYAWRFISHMTLPVRRRLVELLRGKGPLRTAAACEGLAVACMIGAALGGSSSHGAVAAAAALCALVGRLILYTQVEHASRTLRGQPARPAIGSAAMFIIAVALALTAVFLALAAVQGKANSVAFFVAVLVAGAALAVARAGVRRRGAG
jgi:Flp pilus assembly protein TadD